MDDIDFRNRCRGLIVVVVELDFVVWSVNPQVHATDDASVIETASTMDSLARTARQPRSDWTPTNTVSLCYRIGQFGFLESLTSQDVAVKETQRYRSPPGTQASWLLVSLQVDASWKAF